MSASALCSACCTSSPALEEGVAPAVVSCVTSDCTWLIVDCRISACFWPSVCMPEIAVALAAANASMSLRCDSKTAETSIPGSLNFSIILAYSAKRLLGLVVSMITAPKGMEWAGKAVMHGVRTWYRASRAGNVGACPGIVRARVGRARSVYSESIGRGHAYFHSGPRWRRLPCTARDGFLPAFSPHLGGEHETNGDSAARGIVHGSVRTRGTRLRARSELSRRHQRPREQHALDAERRARQRVSDARQPAGRRAESESGRSARPARERPAEQRRIRSIRLSAGRRADFCASAAAGELSADPHPNRAPLAYAMRAMPRTPALP